MERSDGRVRRLFGQATEKIKKLSSRHKLPEKPPVAAIAPRPDPESATGQTAQSRFQIHSKSAPRWNEALEALKRKHPKQYAALENMADDLPDSTGGKPDQRFEWKVPERISENSETSEIVQRMKRYLPNLSALRGIVMAATALDPFKAAPVICASIFFTIDFTLNLMEPHERIRILDALFESSNTINDLISFEARFPQKTHPAIQDDIPYLEGKMPDLYLRALQILSDIQYTHNELGLGAGLRSRAAKLTSKSMDWEEQKEKLKLYRTEWLCAKTIMEGKLSADEKITEVLKGIVDKTDPEPTLEDVGLKVNPDGRYENCAQWFFDRGEYQGWSKGFKVLESDFEYKQTLWIRGGYGTGKTTIIYRVVSTLQSLGRIPFRDEVLRVIPYFCAATGVPSKRPNYEIIIRSLCQKLSLMPDFTLAQPTEIFHNDTKRGIIRLAKDKPWENLMRALLREASNPSRFVFIVDALDECDSPQDAERFLKFMSEILTKHPNVQLLCSSHQQVRVGWYFPSSHKVDVTVSATTKDINAFINSEIEHLRGIIKESSVFFRPDHVDLLDLLKESLTKYADGMFLWVEIWLNILLPTYEDQRDITDPEMAVELLNALKDSSGEQKDVDAKVKAGYQRLWDFNAMRSDILRPRLFHLALCSFEPLSPASMTQALRVQLDGTDEHRLYNDNLQVEDVRRIYSNFLIENAMGYLVFPHNSARSFVGKVKIKDEAGSEIDEFSEKRNHLFPAKLYIEVLKRSDHPLWQHAGMNPANWRDLARYDVMDMSDEYVKWLAMVDDPDKILPYIAKYGLRHCCLAAVKRSLFDDLWTEVLDKLVLSQQSAFPFAGLLVERKLGGFPEDVQQDISFECLVGGNEGHPELLLSHVLAWLDIVDTDDLSDARLWNLKEESVNLISDNGRFRRLFEHSTQNGGRLIRRSRMGMQKHPPDETTALQIACESHNNAAANLILKATDCLYGGSAALDLLHRTISHSASDFAFGSSQNALIKTLLEAELQYSNEKSDDAYAGSVRQPPKVLQWLHRHSMYSMKALGELLGLAQPYGAEMMRRGSDGDSDAEEIPTLIGSDESA